MPYLQNQPHWIRYGIAAVSVLLITLVIDFLPPIGAWRRGALLLPYFIITATTFWLGRNAGLFAAALSVILVNKTILMPLWIENPEDAGILNVMFILLSGLTIASINFQHNLMKQLIDMHQDLKLAQNTGKMGSWRLNLKTNRLFWSDELYKIFGIPNDAPITYEGFLSKVHFDDQAYVDQHWRAVLIGQPYDIEHRIIVNGEVKWIHEKTVLDYAEDGQVTGVFGITQDISPEKKFENELIKQEKQLRLVMNLTPSLISYVNKYMRYERVNKAYEDWWGITPDKILGRTVREMVGENTWPIVKPYLEKALAGERVTFDQELFCHNDVPRWMCVTYAPDIDEKGIVHGIVAHITDIEDRIQAQKALRDGEERIHLATDATGVGIWEWNILTNEFRWDAQMFRIYGIQPTQDSFVQYKTWSNAVVAEDLPLQEEILQTTIKTAGRSCREFRIQRPGETGYRFIEAVETTRTNDHGQVEWVVGTNLDISDRKNAEIGLLKQEKQLSLIMNLTPALISYLDTDFRYLRVNKTYEEWYGLAPEYIIGRTVREIVGENTWKIAAPYLEQARNGETSSYENNIDFKDNTSHWVKATFVPDKDSNGTVEGIVVHVASIDERKQAEQKISLLNQTLQNRLDELQAVFDTAPIGLCLTTDNNAESIRGNQNFEQMLALPPGSELSLGNPSPPPVRIFINGYEPLTEELPMQRAAQGAITKNQVLEIQRPDGEFITVLSNANPILDPAGGVRGAVGAFQDITELIRIQDTFLQSHQLLQTLIEQASIGIAMFDRDMNYLVSSPKWCNDHGLKQLNLAGLNHYKLFPDLPAEWKQYHQRGLAGEFIKKEMDSWIRADGSRRWLRWSLGPWTTVEGQIGGIIIATEDISDRKLVEDKLQASELRMSIALEELKAGYWDWDLITNAVYFSSVWKQQLGFTEKEIPNKYEEWEQRLHPDDRQITLTIIKHHLEGKSKTFEMEFRLLHKNGSYRNIHSHGALIRDDNNQPCRMVGIHLDVTEYQKAKQLEYQQKLLEETAELFVATQTAIAIAHDLNQPLTATAHFADAALELFKTGDASQQMLIYALENCSEQAYRAGKVIPQLIGVLNKSEQINVNEKMDINQIIDETLILLKNSHLYEAVNTELRLESGLPQIKISRLHMQKVLYNLMQNGYDAMIDIGKKNGILIIVTRRFPDAPDTLEVIIRDEGTGVTNKNQLKKIFKPFYTTKKTGSGIGLAICQNLIKSSGGDLWAEQNRGPGLSLHFTLPFIK